MPINVSSPELYVQFWTQWICVSLAFGLTWAITVVVLLTLIYRRLG